MSCAARRRSLLGAVALGHRDGWLVLPGTHSKWVLLRAMA